MAHALITGAAKRVGSSLALQLAREGYDISVHYHRSQDEAQTLQRDIEALGRRCTLIQADLCDATQASTLPQRAAEALGAVTLAIHNASLFERDTIADVTQAALDAHWRIHCTAAVMLAQALYHQPPQATPAHLICLSDGMRGWSISGAFLSYSLSKLALEQFVQLAAPSLAPHVRINAIAPGATLPGVMDTPDTFATLAAAHPLGRTSDLDELAQAVLALERLPSVTGTVLSLGMERPSHPAP